MCNTSITNKFILSVTGIVYFTFMVTPRFSDFPVDGETRYDFHIFLGSKRHIVLSTSQVYTAQGGNAESQVKAR